MTTMNGRAPKLVPSPSFVKSSSPLRSSSFASSSSSISSHLPSHSNHSNGNSPSSESQHAYILNIQSLNNGGGGAQYAVATSSPANAVHVVDGESLRVLTSLRGPEPVVPTSNFTFGSGSGKKGGSKSGGGGFSFGGAGGGGGGPQAHYAGVTCVRTSRGGWGAGGEALVSCGREGSVVVWDVRSGGVGVLMHSLNPYSKPRPLLSLALSSSSSSSSSSSPSSTSTSSSSPLIAVGSELQGDDAVISFFDPRNPSKALREHASTHSDDVTVLEFAPPSYSLPASSDGDDNGGSAEGISNRQYLLSGGTDGLLSISDANEEDEDEAVLCTANWGCSVAQAGWVPAPPPQSRSSKDEWGVWAGSDMETFSTWTADLSPVLDFDVREPGVHEERGVEWVTDYLVGCYTPESGGELRVVVGSNEGDLSTLTPSHPLRPSRRTGPRPWYIHNSYTHAHVGVVRALCVDARNGVVLTGGEDARVNVWRDLAGSSLYVGEDDDESEEESEGEEGDEGMGMDVDGEEEGKRGKGRKRGVSPGEEGGGRKRRR